MKKKLLGVMLLVLASSMVTAQEEGATEGKSVANGDFSSTGGKSDWKSEFGFNAAVDVRGFVGPKLKEDSQWKQWSPAANPVYGGAQINKGQATFVDFSYKYGPFVGAELWVGVEAKAEPAVAYQFGANPVIAIERAIGWVDVLGVAQVDKYVGLKLTMGYFYFEPHNSRLTAAAMIGNSVVDFDMGTKKTQHASLRDPMNIRFDVPFNIVKAKTGIDLNLGVSTDLDFSWNGDGQSVLAEITAKNIKIGNRVDLGVTAFGNVWQGVEKKDGNGENVGQWAVGGSLGLDITTVGKDKIKIGASVDYEDYWGNMLYYQYLDDFNIHQVNGKVDNTKLYGNKKGNFSFEAGIGYEMPKYVTIRAAYISWVDKDRKYSFSTDETVQAAKAADFISTRVDFNMIKELTGLVPFAGVSVGLVDPRPGFWDQAGRVGWTIGTEYKPVSNLTLRTGWRMGSSLIGNVNSVNNGSKEGEFFIRAKWDIK